MIILTITFQSVNLSVNNNDVLKMTISKLSDGCYLVDVRPRGVSGNRVRKKFKTKSEALNFERWVIAEHNQKEWLSKPVDTKSLLELIDLWWTLKGQTLRDGHRMRNKLLAMNDRMSYPQARHITPAFFSEYRASRLSAGIQPKTVNLEMGHLSGVFTTVISLGHYRGINPIRGIKKLRVIQTERGFLTTDEISNLLSELAGDNELAVRLCLSTGARWSEAANLCANNVMKDRVIYNQTKNGRNRTVPISIEFATELCNGRSGLLLPCANYQEVRLTIKKIAPHLPDGQGTHVLRHSFASHFMMNGGNILALQKILGHSSIEQTLVYSHFSPDYLFDAVRFNPLSKINK